MVSKLKCQWPGHNIDVIGFHDGALVHLSGFLNRLLVGTIQRDAHAHHDRTPNAPIQELPYPAITLCSPNQMTKTNVAHFRRTLVDGNLTMNLEAILPQLLGFYEQVVESNLHFSIYKIF
ncbi:hypothetical protein EVAR_91516_1 [Eumeta japonica]|uniref:Uncharacterized protein n=1 Tax=Eumeta variegata TaxID=151549 RepID=A0A4C1VEA2_EUMVA|nr:hypothetical protein EVAR_91516_1 [Eumeta japonica]